MENLKLAEAIGGIKKLRPRKIVKEYWGSGDETDGPMSQSHLSRLLIESREMLIMQFQDLIQEGQKECSIADFMDYVFGVFAFELGENISIEREIKEELVYETGSISEDVDD